MSATVPVLAAAAAHPHPTPIASLVGGVLIGASAAALLLFSGKIAGVTGIVAGTLRSQPGNRAWRLWFLAGLVGGGTVSGHFWPAAFSSTLARPTPTLLLAGLLVGFGTRLGNGCTSGHGVCGIGRLSRRSLVATAVFVAVAAATVLLTKGAWS